MPRINWLVVGVLAAVTFMTEAVIGFGLMFAPGWANQWP